VPNRSQFALLFFAASTLALGVLALIYGDFALVWQPVPTWVPARTALAYASGILMIVCAMGLLYPRTKQWATTILFAYIVLWAFLKVPPLLTGLQHEGNWLGLGELTVIVAGAWTLWATQSPSRTRYLRPAQMLLGLSLIPIGTSHIIYHSDTADLIPTWIPFHPFWAYFTGAAHIAAGLALLFSVIPSVAATLEAVMLTLFGLLVWLPQVLAGPTARLPWTAFWITGIIAGATWLVAAGIS
jgi:uncharacterized membrane protein